MRLLWLLLPIIPSAFAGNNSDPLFWGTYRPNLYFGLRPKVPQSLMTGLMWFGTQDYQSITRTERFAVSLPAQALTRLWLMQARVMLATRATAWRDILGPSMIHAKVACK